MAIEIKNIDKFLDAIHSTSRISKYTHDFYRYPARFSPEFAKWAIELFTEPGDWIVDPFMGGGTSIVEAKLLGRNALGCDISSLATFLAQTKTQIVEKEKVLKFKHWAIETIDKLNCHKPSARPTDLIVSGCQRNINTKKTWPIRKIIEQALQLANELNDRSIERYYRCALLKTGQWALDSRKEIPSASEFRKKFKNNVQNICESAISFTDEVNKINSQFENFDIPRTTCLNQSVEELNNIDLFKKEKPKLILTSPPYPGIHILYHRWQVLGRRETPAPFWIANSLDGEGSSYYTLGNRQQDGLIDYFENIKEAFKAISKVCAPETLIIQMLAFSNPDWQMPKYLEVMKSVGLREIILDSSRIWRDIPNRKWYTQNKRSNASSREVILLHKLRD